MLSFVVTAVHFLLLFLVVVPTPRTPSQHVPYPSSPPLLPPCSTFCKHFIGQSVHGGGGRVPAQHDAPVRLRQLGSHQNGNPQGEATFCLRHVFGVGLVRVGGSSLWFVALFVVWLPLFSNPVFLGSRVGGGHRVLCISCLLCHHNSANAAKNVYPAWSRYVV